MQLGVDAGATWRWRSLGDRSTSTRGVVLRQCATISGVCDGRSPWRAVSVKSRVI